MLPAGRADAALDLQQPRRDERHVCPGIGLDARAGVDQQMARVIGGIFCRKTQIRRMAYQVIQLYLAREILQPAAARPQAIVRLQFEAEGGGRDPCT